MRVNIERLVNLPCYKDGKMTIHPNAREISCEDNYPCGDIITMECPDCGIRWKEELPQ